MAFDGGFPSLVSLLDQGGEIPEEVMPARAERLISAHVLGRAPLGGIGASACPGAALRLAVARSVIRDLGAL